MFIYHAIVEDCGYLDGTWASRDFRLCD